MSIRNGRIYNDHDINMNGSGRTTNPAGAGRASRSEPTYCTVSFDRCGGTFVPTRRCVRGGQVVMPAFGEISRKGYVLLGWAHPWDPGNPVVSPGDRVTVNDDETYRAVWRRPNYDRNRRYTVTLDMGNGRVERVGNLCGEVTLPTGGDLGYTRNELVGWRCDGQRYYPGAHVVLDSDVTFTAEWDSGSSTYAVTFDTGGGSSVQGRRIRQNTSFNLPSDHDVRRYGYRLSGWRCSGMLYRPGSSVYVTRDSLFEALWEVCAGDTSCRVRFHTADGTHVPDRTVTRGTLIYLPGAGSTSRSGYVLSAWRTGSVTYNPGASVVIFFDTDFTAVWSVLQRHSLRFDTRGGTPIPDTGFTGTTSVRLPDADDTRLSGYHLDAWLIDGTRYSPGTYVVLSEDSTACAVWSRITPKCTVRYTDSYGTAPDELEVLSGADVTLPVSRGISPGGRRLRCWRCGDTEYVPGDRVTVNGDVVFHAVWEDRPPRRCVVRYLHSCGTVPDEIEVEPGTVLTLPVSGGIIPRGRRLRCWRCGDTEYVPGDRVTVNGDVVFHAVWEDVPSGYVEDQPEGSVRRSEPAVTSPKGVLRSGAGAVSASFALLFWLLLIVCVWDTYPAITEDRELMMLTVSMVLCFIASVASVSVGLLTCSALFVACWMFVPVSPRMTLLAEVAVVACALFALFHACRKRRVRSR